MLAHRVRLRKIEARRFSGSIRVLSPACFLFGGAVLYCYMRGVPSAIRRQPGKRNGDTLRVTIEAEDNGR